jgi:hypothetical protein
VIPPTPAPALYDVVEEEAWDEEEWAPPAIIEAEPAGEADLEPEPLVAAAPSADLGGFDFDVDFELEVAPIEDDAGEGPDPDDIEVFEVVSPAPRRLARAGSR